MTDDRAKRIDLDDLERKARAAEQSAWTTDDVAVAIVKAEGGEQIADTYDNTPWPDRRCVANAQHIAAASPPVVLAMIARIRRLEETLQESCERVESIAASETQYDDVADDDDYKDAQRWRGVLCEGAVLS